MKINMNKKAMFFTLLAIALLSLFLVSYTFYSTVKNREAINRRIKTMNNFVFSVEQDIPRQLYTSGFRIIFLFEKKIIEDGNYISNLNATFNETFFDGTIYGETNEEIEQLMSGATFSGIKENIQEKADKINIDVDFLNPSLAVTQEDPWNVKFTLTANLLIKDKTNLVLWNKTSSIAAYIPIEKFEDPLYIIETSGLVANKINKTAYNIPITIGNLPSHVENSYYIASTSAPSFLDRLEGKKEPNENGIESLVYLPGLSAQGIPIKSKSCVDYIYFSENNPPSQNVNGMPSWFRLDDDHLNSGVYI